MEYGKASAILHLPSLDLSASHPAIVRCHYYTCSVLLSLNQFENAIKEADEIIVVLPDYKWAYVLRGRALMGINEISYAIESFNEALLGSPNFADAHLAKVEVEFIFTVQEAKRVEAVELQSGEATGAEEGLFDAVEELEKTIE